MDATLLTKLQKITRLIDRAGTPGEAEAAAAALSRLLLKYNLDEAEVRRANGESESSAIVVQKFSVGKVGGAYLWRWYLVSTIARANLTEVVRDGGTPLDGWIVGTKQNVEAVLDLNQHLADVFQRLAAESWTKEGQHGSWYLTRTKYINAFLLGVAPGLREKFAAERREAAKENGHVNALVVVNSAAIRDTIREEIGRTRDTSQHRRVGDADAYQHGYRAGRNYREDAAVGGTSHPALT